ncbi:hypothetical protein DY000_02038518 [Brassica cretica]|uniref:Imidazole glycerol-phosphate synthase n=1 Tax=Brassica cretica TaxID=69181 RepID=A0ABQ7BQ77_BRACR|nr:hypothetical protein DY000_02038518 [Brassica cretica]
MERKASKLAKRVIACLDVRTNDKGDLVVTKGDQYDVREQSNENEVRNLGKPVDLAGQYYKDGADEISFLNITGFRDFPLGDLPMIQVLRYTSENVFVPLTVGGGIRDFTDATGRYYSSLEVAAEYFRSGADKISIGSDAVYAAEEFVKSGVKTGKSSLEQISRVYGNQFSRKKRRRRKLEKELDAKSRASGKAEGPELTSFVRHFPADSKGDKAEEASKEADQSRVKEHKPEIVTAEPPEPKATEPSGSGSSFRPGTWQPPS